MAELLAVPFKTPIDVSTVEGLTNVINCVTDKPVEYTTVIEEFDKLRHNAIWKVFDKHESSLGALYGYYDQLVALERKIPSEVSIKFKWNDAFAKSSFLKGRNSLMIPSLAYEKVCVLYEIAALQSSIAIAQVLDTDEGLKVAAKYFQQAAGIFNYLKGNVIGAIRQEPTPDLLPDTLAALETLMLAQAQEVFVHKAILDNMKNMVIAKLSSQCEDLYSDCYKLLQNENIKHMWPKNWIPVVGSKKSVFLGIAEYYQSLVCRDNQAFGEVITRLKRSIELLQDTPKWKTNFVTDHLSKGQRLLEEAQRDNSFIYNERIPDHISLESIPKASIAKALPIPAQYTPKFSDLFESVTPLAVQQSLSAFEARKNELVSGEINKLREATQLLNGVLASLNLPAAVEVASSKEVPQSLIEKAEFVANNGGVETITDKIKNLKEALQRNREIINETYNLLDKEKRDDLRNREIYKEKWTRMGSDELTKAFRTNLEKYESLIQNAVNADQTVEKKFNDHRSLIDVLSEGPDKLLEGITDVRGTDTAQGSSAAAKLLVLMHKVEELKAERDKIESELQTSTHNMREKFTQALAEEGNVNEQALSVETLGRIYSPLQKKVKDSIEKQETLLNEIQVQNSIFCDENHIKGTQAEKRVEIFQSLIAGHNAFKELMGNLDEGLKFYNDLTQMLLSFQSKINDFVTARKAEMDDFLEDMAGLMNRNCTVSAPDVPSYHQTSNSNDSGTKIPPPRPPPPNVPVSAPSGPTYPPAGHATLPYPTYPQGMPMPFGMMQPNAHQPMNPYATLPYPHISYVYGVAPPNYPGAVPYPQYPPPSGNQ